MNTEIDSDDDVVIEEIINKELSSIFDDDMIEKFTDNNGKQKWKCLWCKTPFSGWNATKAIAHVNKKSKSDIQPCKSKIDHPHTIIYKKILNDSERKRIAKNNTNSHMERSIDTHNIKATSLLEERRDNNKNKRMKVTSSLTNVSNQISYSNSPNLSDITGATNSCTFSKKYNNTITNNNNGKDNKSYHQIKIHDGPNPLAESQLQMAIADMVHSCGLPFSLVSDQKFRKVISLARIVGSTFIVPTRNYVAGELLDINYNTYMESTWIKITNELNIFGVCLYGDGATVKKMPLINILSSSAHHTVGVLEIVDCSAHVASGAKKDAPYIASLFRPHIDKLEKESLNCVDVLYFDGASNVQKAGRLLEATFPRIVVLHGAEHVISLFFTDIFKLSEFKFFNLVARRTYRLFGSGSMHAPYAMFHKYSKQHNEGKSIGLIRAAGTRMAGNIIVLLRLMRLKPALINTITSSEFTKLKVSLIKYSYLI